MSRDYLHPDESIEKHGWKLPHWQQGEAMQFVTFRLGDSLPKDKIDHWKTQRDAWKRTWPRPWTPELEKEYHRRFTARLEVWLDQGAGSCLLRDEGNRHLLETVLMFHHGERYEHHAWVIMPNHVHLLFKPLDDIPSLIQTWKSISARRIGSGSIWQANYRDTMIRDGDYFANAVRYIRRNPVKAKLREGNFSLWQSEMALAVS
ncbi:MAG: transposase [Luteolibacter sp.]|uniref:transposase n=1 Tax=Luteolibacter sp. TaxID=1962973 RepID=UPI00326562CC